MAIAGRLYGPERRRYVDPATEFEVIRLTDPAFASGMTSPQHHQFGRRSDSLLHWSDRSGARQAYRLDLKDGSSRQLTDAAALNSFQLSQSPDEHSFFHFDGPVLNETALSSLKTRQVHQAESNDPKLAVLTDGSVVIAEKSSLTRIDRKGTARTVQVDGNVTSLQARPRRPQVLAVWEGAVSLVDFASGAGKKALKLEPGRTGEIAWTAPGKTFIYLHIPEDTTQLITLREHSPDDGGDRLLAKTSQFVSVASNSDASVFTGASRSKAQPYILILLRAARRELTLCEHKASEPQMAQPVFAPDSQSVFFNSDRHGKSAIYRVHVEKFVEETEPA